MATIQGKKSYIWLHFHFSRSMIVLQVNTPLPLPARFFLNFRKRTYLLWLDVIQNAWHCKVTAIDFQRKWAAFVESQNRTNLYSKFFFLVGMQFQGMEQLCMLQVCAKPLDSSYIEIDLWVETIDVFLSPFLRTLRCRWEAVGHVWEQITSFVLVQENVYWIRQR